MRCVGRLGGGGLAGCLSDVVLVFLWGRCGRGGTQNVKQIAIDYVPCSGN